MSYLLIGLSVIAFILLILVLRKREWGQILGIVVSVIFFLCSLGPTILVLTGQIEVTQGSKPDLEIKEIMPSCTESQCSFSIEVINEGAGRAEKCTSLIENLTTGEKNHLWVSETINSGDFGKVWLAESRKVDEAWKTWLITPGLGDALTKGYVLEKIPWASPLPSGVHKLRLTILAETKTIPREFELSNPPDSPPTLK